MREGKDIQIWKRVRKAVQKRRMEGRKRFITNFIYFIILGGIFLFCDEAVCSHVFPVYFRTCGGGRAVAAESKAV